MTKTMYVYFIISDKNEDFKNYENNTLYNDQNKICDQFTI